LIFNNFVAQKNIVVGRFQKIIKYAMQQSKAFVPLLKKMHTIDTSIARNDRFKIN